MKIRGHGETKCVRCGCVCQGFVGPDGAIYCWDCYIKEWGEKPFAED